MKLPFRIRFRPVAPRNSDRTPLLWRGAVFFLATGLSIAGIAAWAQGAPGTTGTPGATTPAASGPNGAISFTMVRSAGIVKAGCAPDATASVTVQARGPVEEMTVSAQGLPANTGFDFFVIQVPNAPFGLSWYQGDIETDAYGSAKQTFIGRFNEETFIVAPGSANAPVVHNKDFPDASSNPQTAPIHTYHLGLWFNSPDDAAKAGCPNTATPFNGEHNAGPQVLNTSQYPDTQGPLFSLKP